MDKIEFLEKQRFNQWWLWLLLIGAAMIPVYGLYKQTVIGEAFGDNPMSNYGLLVFLLFMILILVFFRRIQLITSINRDAIKIDFFPFTNRIIHWKDVAEAKVVNYGFVGGWGVRLGTKYGTVYNTSGKIGLAITLKSRIKLCIGTQKEAELIETIALVNKKYV